jgi:C-5 cytosine-specific DNA methylase
MTQLTFLWAEPPARTSPSPGLERVLLETEALLPSNLCILLDEFVPVGWFGKTSPASCRSTNERLEPSSGSWGNAGMGSPTGFLTLSISEFHSAAVASSLSDILETGDLPQRYFLSPKACAGILRRAEKRGKELPLALREALTANGGRAGIGVGAVAFHENQRAELTTSDTAGSLKVGGGKPGQGYPALQSGMSVRRLTPRECERLQGFPNGYTAIAKAADGPRYRALGNSMAVPCMRWLGERIQLVEAML